MKCIHCEANTGRKKRTDGRCIRCGHPFAFQSGEAQHWISDAAFKNAADRVSSGRTVWFTDRHLWYELNRRWMTRGILRRTFPAFPYVLGGGLPWIVAAQFFASTAMYVLAGVGALGGAGISLYRTRRELRREPPPQGPPHLPFPEFRSKFLLRWIDVHGDIPALLPGREKAAAALPREVPPDVAAFSFDRAVVTDRWETAQMLVANRFHFEHNCAVLSVDGFPDGIADTLKEMLRRNPRLTVFALHDAGVEGCRLPLTLREPEWFPDPAVRIVDLGLRPEAARRLRLPVLKGPSVPVPARLGQMLAREDHAWLAAGRSAELAAVRPARVMRVAYKGIVAAGRAAAPAAKADASNPGGGGAYYDGGVIWIGDLRVAGDTAAVDGFG